MISREIIADIINFGQNRLPVSKRLSVMVSNDTFRKLALSFQGTEENPHFERRAFKISGRRIFATLHEEQHTANMKFSPKEQAIYCSFDKQSVYPIPNKWGLQGWTTFELNHLPVELVADALLTAYNEVIRPPGKEKKNRKPKR